MHHLIHNALISLVNNINTVIKIYALILLVSSKYGYIQIFFMDHMLQQNCGDSCK